MADTKVKLEVRGLTKRFSPQVTVGPLSFDVMEGEFFSLLGPSGCGKTTTLRCIGGFETLSEGSISLDGRRLHDRPPHRRDVGLVFQSYALFPHLTVFDNIAFGLRHAGQGEAEVRAQTTYALEFMGLKDFARAYPAQLSGGMRQRVCIARTLVLKPRLILLDEPFGALDQQTRLLMGDELLRLWRETRATILLITHALDEATMLADRVGVMSARPGRFLEIVTTRWPRDRDSTIVSNEAFGRLTSRIWALLRGESLRALGREQGVA